MGAITPVERAKTRWQDEVFNVLKQHEVKHIVYVPDAGHSTAIKLAEADDAIHSVVLTTEEEGIGYLAGAWLGGERGALLMQSRGVGNCINPRALPACIDRARALEGPGNA
jgi:sulfopyruvate decarboxylase TPP-binding subunit